MTQSDELFKPVRQGDKSEYVKEILQLLHTEQFHRRKTNLTKRQVHVLTRLSVFNARYGSVVGQVIEQYLTDYVISIGAMGWKDTIKALVSLIQSETESETDPKRNRTLLARLLGR